MPRYAPRFDSDVCWVSALPNPPPGSLAPARVASVGGFHGAWRVLLRIGPGPLQAAWCTGLRKQLSAGAFCLFAAAV